MHRDYLRTWPKPEAPMRFGLFVTLYAGVLLATSLFAFTPTAFPWSRTPLPKPFTDAPRCYRFTYEPPVADEYALLSARLYPVSPESEWSWGLVAGIAVRGARPEVDRIASWSAAITDSLDIASHYGLTVRIPLRGDSVVGRAQSDPQIPLLLTLLFPSRSFVVHAIRTPCDQEPPARPSN